MLATENATVAEKHFSWHLWSGSNTGKHAKQIDKSI
jgi:hypothetical protein